MADLRCRSDGGRVSTSRVAAASTATLSGARRGSVGGRSRALRRPAIPLRVRRVRGRPGAIARRAPRGGGRGRRRSRHPRALGGGAHGPAHDRGGATTGAGAVRRRGALGVVVEAREAHQRGVAGARRRGDVIDEVLARAHPHDLSRLRRVDQLSPGHRRATNDRNHTRRVKRGGKVARRRGWYEAVRATMRGGVHSGPRGHRQDSLGRPSFPPSDRPREDHRASWTEPSPSWSSSASTTTTST